MRVIDIQELGNWIWFAGTSGMNFFIKSTRGGCSESVIHGR